MLHLNSYEACSFGRDCRFSLECYGLRSDRPNEFICEFWEDENPLYDLDNFLFTEQQE